MVGTVLVIDFTLADQRFLALNGGTPFPEVKRPTRGAHVFRSRKSRIRGTITSALSSKAKWPVSRR
jgi:hypothetical protein